MRTGRRPGGRGHLVEQALLGDDVEAVAEAHRGVACDERRETVPAFLGPGVALVETLDELGDEHLRIRGGGGQWHRRAAHRTGAELLDAETAS